MQSVFLSAILWTSVLAFVLVGADRRNDLALANNALGFDLYKLIGNETREKNAFLSPISISSAFGMTYLGARGDTRAQMRTALHFEKVGPDTTVKEAFKELLTEFAGQNKNYTLNLVNKLFGSNDFQLKEEFQTESQNYFRSTAENLDFKNHADASRLHINGWVETQTKQKIKDLLPSGTVDQNTLLVIVNAIYFNGVWTHPFDRNLTKSGTFQISKTERVPIDMMALPRDTYFKYYQSTEMDCQVLEMPYVGSQASMVIFLPREVDGLSKVEQLLTAEKLDATLKSTTDTKIQLTFPKFKLDFGVYLKKFLEKLGMKDLFCPGHSDLSGFGGPGRVTVTEAIHKSYVSVDEIGTEAAAATAIIGVGSAPGSTININVNRPFLFLILEKNTNTVLFLGRLVRPPDAAQTVGKFGETAALRGGATSNAVELCLVLSAVALLFNSRRYFC